jgi:hypothetical protein
VLETLQPLSMLLVPVIGSFSVVDEYFMNNFRFWEGKHFLPSNDFKAKTVMIGWTNFTIVGGGFFPSAKTKGEALKPLHIP